MDEQIQHGNYDGPGVYKHYKGGLYIVFGLSKLEYNEGIHVAYMTLNRERQRDNWYNGFFCIFRPLEPADGPDCWNSLVEYEGEITPRFVKVTG